MAPVDVERVYAIFNLFAVTPPPSSSTSSRAAREAYIPAYFLAVATREVGFYPTTRATHQFVKSVPTASAGEITFAAFLQFCEDVAYTNRPGRSAIYKLIDDLDTRGGGLISRRELFLILTSGSADISDGEVDAVMDLLDPTLSGYVELKDIAALLIDQSQRQCSLSRAPRSRSRPESQATAATSMEPQPPLQQPGPHRHHHHRTSVPSAGPTPADKPQERKKVRRFLNERTAHPAPQPQHQQQRQQQWGAKRRASADRASRDGTAHEGDEPAPRRPHQHKTTPSTSPSEPQQVGGVRIAAAATVGAAPVAAADRDRSFKRTDVNSNGDAAYRKYGSAFHRANTFERTQTAMTIDVDCLASLSRTPGRQKPRDGRTPSPNSRLNCTSGKASAFSTPVKGPAAPLPLGPSATEAATAAASPTVPVEAKGDRTARLAASEGSERDLSRPSQGEGDGGTSYYSRVEGPAVMRPAHEEPQSASDVQQPATPPPPPLMQPEGGAARVAPSNPPRGKDRQTKCCTMF